MWYLKLICVIYMSVQVTSEDVAGLNMTTRRIYAGKPVSITEAPFMTVLFRNDFEACGASVVHKRFLVSAGHCFTPGYYFFKVGTDILSGGDRYDIQAVYIHPLYVQDPITKRVFFDLSVVKLTMDLTFSDRVRVIELAPRNFEIEPGTLMKTYGFGLTETAPFSNILLGSQVQYIDSEICSRLIHLSVTAEEMCASGAPAKGDSGGPLVYNEMLVGVISYGRLTSGRLPLIYTRVSALRYYITFIIEHES